MVTASPRPESRGAQSRDIPRLSRRHRYLWRSVWPGAQCVRIFVALILIHCNDEAFKMLNWRLISDLLLCQFLNQWCSSGCNTGAEEFDCLPLGCTVRDMDSKFQNKILSYPLYDMVDTWRHALRLNNTTFYHWNLFVDFICFPKQGVNIIDKLILEGKTRRVFLEVRTNFQTI